VKKRKRGAWEEGREDQKKVTEKEGRKGPPEINQATEIILMEAEAEDKRHESRGRSSLRSNQQNGALCTCFRC
jgi:hypothetical protein